MTGHETPRPSVGRAVGESPAEVGAYWAEALPRAEAAMARARQLAPQLVGLTVSDARDLVARDPGLSFRVLPRGPISAEAQFGRINATVVDDRVVATSVG